MTVLTTSLRPSDPDTAANRQAHLDALDIVAQAADKPRPQGGGEGPRTRHLSRGKMLPRDRVANLLDPGSPFLEIGATAAHGMYDDAAPCAGMIAGIGQVHGRQVMVVCNDATVKGGTYYPPERQETPPRAGDRRAEPLALRLPGGPRAAPTSPTRTRSSPIATISGASSTTRRK